MEVLINNDTARVIYHPQLNYVSVDWNGYCCGEPYREALDDLITIILHKKSNKVLLNQSQKDIFYTDDTIWSFNEWYPRLVKALGMNGKLAVVFSSKHNTLTMEQKRYSWTTSNKFFTSVKDAVNWLAQ